ncbi:MAG: hypothetical protein JWM58_3811 [Rhizobium sp.]|nr:hypothetical protein [Rhizobium sp.]
MSKVIHLFPSSPHHQTQASTEAGLPRRARRDAKRGETNALAIANAIASGSFSDDHEPVIEIERIIAIVLRTCKRLGRKPSTISSLIAADLDRHCKKGDPTARMLRDWLDGKSVPLANAAWLDAARDSRCADREV